MLGTAQDTGKAARIQRVAIAMLATAASYFNAGGQRFESLRLPARDAVAAAAEPNPRPATQPWTTQGGARFTGSFVRLEDGNVVIETDQGEVQELSFDELSQANQQTIYRNQDRWGVGGQRVWNVGGHIENLVVGWVTDYDPIRTVVTIATGTTGGVQHEVDWASLGANERRHVLDWDRKEQAGDEPEPSAPKPSRETGEESAQTSQPRAWTDIQGRTIEAQLVQILTDEKGRIGGIQVRLRDRLFDISLDNLSEEDREFVKELHGEESPSQISSTPIASQEELHVLEGGMRANTCPEARRYVEFFEYAVTQIGEADVKSVAIIPVPNPQHLTGPSNLGIRIIFKEPGEEQYELYDLAEGFQRGALLDPRGAAISLPEAFASAAYRPTNRGFYTLFVVSTGGKLQYIDNRLQASGEPVPVTMDGEPATARGVAFYRNSLLVVAQGAAKSGIVVYNVANRKQTDVLFAGQLNSPEHIATRPDGTVAISQADGSLVVGNVATEELTAKIEPADGQSVSVGFVETTGDLLVIHRYKSEDCRSQEGEFTFAVYEIP